MRNIRLFTTPAVLLGLLVLVIWGGSWGWGALTKPPPSPPPTPCVNATTSAIVTSQVGVRVFNTGFTSGLGGRTGSRLRNAGFNVLKIGNSENRVKGTVIRANAREKAQIQLVASYFNKPTIEHDDRVDGSVDVLLGTDFPGPGSKPLKQTRTDGGQACILVPPSPKP